MKKFGQRPRRMAALAAFVGLSSACGISKGTTRDVRDAQEEVTDQGSILVLYKDLSFVRYRTNATFDEGGDAVLQGIAVGSDTEAQLATGQPLSSQRVQTKDGAAASSSTLINEKVVVVTKNGSIAGTVIERNHRGLGLATVEGVTVITDPVLALKVVDPLFSGRLQLRGGEPGTRDVEIRTWLPGLRWQVAYTVVLSGLNANTATIQGWLSIDSSVAEPINAARIAIVEGRARRGTNPSNSTNPPSPAQIPRAPITLIDRAVELKGGGAVRLPLFRGRRRTGATVARVFDPVGPHLSHQGVTPIARKGYGANRNGEVVAVSLSVKLDLSEEELAELPKGEVSLLARSGDSFRALGSTIGFGRLPRSEGGLDFEGDKTMEEPVASTESPSSSGELRIGIAPGLTGKRWQGDFFRDQTAKRLVEEIRVELTNSSDEASTVVVHEHLYRGLTWSLAYQNGAGEATKAGPQTVHFDVEVPANGTKLLMYRVVYEG